MKLPENFESFEEARKEGFLKIKALREEGVNVVGVFCTYTPVELINAAGAVAVSLCGVNDADIPFAEIDLPKNLCPLIKSSYGSAVSNRCPYFYFSDLVVGETTCDGKKKMYELLGEHKPVHVMNLPQGQKGQHSHDYWKEEMELLRERLEEVFEIEITDKRLRDAIVKKNKERKILLDFYELGKLNPSPIKGYEINEVMESIGFQFNKEEQNEFLKERIEEIKDRYNKEFKGKTSYRPRILITGCPTSGVRDKIIKTIEDSGADVVAFENCAGVREKKDLVDETIDPIEALTEKYLNVSCSVMTPNPKRFEILDEMIDEYEIDGVIEVILQACHTFNVEAYNVKKFVTEEKNKPYLEIETDYSKNDVGQINTRINAYLEML